MATKSNLNNLKKELMGLIDKFLQHCDDVYVDKEVNAEYCEQIAEEFAIGFAEWLLENQSNCRNTQQQLEIYKKTL